VGTAELAARNVRSFAPTTLKFFVIAIVLGGGGGGGATYDTSRRRLSILANSLRTSGVRREPYVGRRRRLLGF